MRQYEPIWRQVKKRGKAVLAAPVANHRRIIQAVRKEKWKDVAFRYLASEQGLEYRLVEEADTDKQTITFTLVKIKKIRITDL